MQENKEILRVENLKKYFSTPRGLLYAVDDISFSLNKGETLGVVGESGCGKSTLGRAILRLHEPTDGKVFFEGDDILKYDKKQMKQKRSDMQIIFQDPYSSLNPRMTVSQSIAAPLLIQGIYKNNQKDEIQKKVDEMMDLVGLAKRFANSYPHELDGGRRQRIGIARALSLNPKFIVCDEPVSALDVSIQAQVLNLMQDLQEKLGLTYLFITHNLSVVKHLSSRIMVMYLGQMVELATPQELFANPMHPYTKALLSAIPTPDPDKPMERIDLKGELSSPINVPVGCRFAKRCVYARPECETTKVEMKEISPGHFVSCHLCK
ncbi:MAG: ATP-binding cassette domain-containing protein [Lachnospiraceae bacterium]|nr:ATP-binding cassette domain-containing protein [Lachnospiraceae bacterium]